MAAEQSTSAIIREEVEKRDQHRIHEALRKEADELRKEIVGLRAYAAIGRTMVGTLITTGVFWAFIVAEMGRHKNAFATGNYTAG